MFESDDYDQILSQFDFSNIPTNTDIFQDKPDRDKRIYDEKCTSFTSNKLSSDKKQCKSSKYEENIQLHVNESSNNIDGSLNALVQASPKHTKRKIINSHFDYKTKRKFPGPAGLLTGSLQESRDESICQMELFSQDIDYSENNIRRGLFELPLWIRLEEDVKKWNICDVDTIKVIKQQAMTGNLPQRKAQAVTAFVEAVDRSVTDPLIVLRDCTGNIKGTLHRDVWSLFSSYIVAEYCALVLWKPTVLTTGSAFKRHYLNITLSNIYGIYSSAVVQDDSEATFPDGYVKECEENLTIIKAMEIPKESGPVFSEEGNNANGLFDNLDSIFSDDLF